MIKKNKIDQGSHTDKKKSVKPVESEITKELKKGDEITKALIEQRKAQAEKEMLEKAKESVGAKFEAKLGEPNLSKAEKWVLVDAYKKANPIKYSLKKAALEKWAS